MLTAFAVADLAVLVITAALGFAALVRWGRHGEVPSLRAAAHAAIQALSIGLWAAFVLTGPLWLAWVTFGLLTAGQFAGEQLAYARFRGRHPDVAKPGYLQVVGDGMRLPAPAFHAWVGAVGWFGMLAVCIVATVA